MMKNLLTFMTLSLAFLLHGCTSIVDATTKEPINPDPGKRSLGTYVDDKRLQVIVGVNIRKADPALKLSHIEVTSFNGVILLTGQVPTEALRQLAGQTAKAVNTVRQVHNELQARDNTAFLSRSNDTWLATKVKSNLIADKEIKGLRIKTIVEDGVVYLMGLVAQSEASKIANIVSNIGGVKEVVRVFEYID
jgi:osmotically-inducible protein OsmY